MAILQLFQIHRNASCRTATMMEIHVRKLSKSERRDAKLSENKREISIEF